MIAISSFGESTPSGRGLPLMFIDPACKIIGKHQGEITQGMLDRFMSDLVDEYDEKGLIQRSELTFNLEKEKEL